VEALARGTETPEVRAVLVRLGEAEMGLARAGELGALLAELGQKMPVWCYADHYGNATLALAARGCKRVWAAPGGSVDAVGIAIQQIYFHKLLADEIGLDIDFLQVGKYKGAEEPFTRDGPSPEAKASLTSTVASLRAGWLDAIEQGRPAARAAAEDGPYSPQAAKERGLVDDVGYFDEARKALEKEAGAVRAEARLGAGASNDSDGFGDVLRALAGDALGGAPVVVVEAIGAIAMEGGGGLSGDSGIVERRLIRTLVRLERDDDVKAVVLRIDSPGGSALASDLLWHELMAIRHKKKLVVSVGGMAASGGYYLASSGEVVFADPTSIVGSIGVVGGKIAVGKALERIGVYSDTVSGKPGDPAATSRATSESVLTPWDDATRERMLATMTGIYDLFLARVSEGRGIPVEKVAESAEGKLFGGREAKDRRLIDEIGGLRDAIARARTLAGLPADARVETAGSSGGLLRTLTEDDTESPARSAEAPLPSAAGAAARLLGLGDDLRAFAASVLPLTTGEHALCALPFALTVR
jgi:protease-4